MKYIITILLFLPLATKAQDKIADRLHKYTDSFMFYRCHEQCAVKAGDQNLTSFFHGLAQRYYHLAYDTYVVWDKHRLDAKQKTHLRFMDPDKYFKCPCH